MLGVAQAQTPAPQPETQNQASVILRAPRLDTPPVYIGFSLQQVEGKPGIFRLDAKRVDAQQLLTALVNELKGTATFEEGAILKTENGVNIIYRGQRKASVTLPQPFEATIEQLIQKVAATAKFQVERVNNKWTFYPASIRLSLTTVPSRKLDEPKSSSSYNFNFNRNPGKIPDNAKPFEFNGDLYYHVPTK